MKKIVITVGLVILGVFVFLVLTGWCLGDTQKEEQGLEKSHSIRLSQLQVDEEILEPIVQRVKPLNDIIDRNLKVSRRTLTPFSHIEDTIGLTFNLDRTYEGVKVIVTDEQGYEMATYLAEASNIVVEGTAGLQELFVYKTDLRDVAYSKGFTYTIVAGGIYSESIEVKAINEERLSLHFFGDIQGYKMSQYTKFRQVYEMALDPESTGIVESPDLFYLAGDIVDKGDSYDQWQYFDEAMSDYLSKTRILSTIGNHDVKYSDTTYVSTFNYPKNGVIGLEERNYYTDTKYGRIASIDTESPKRFEEQRDWLLSVMNAEEVNGFRLVLMHRSVYPMSYDEGHIRKWAEVFEEAGIDLVLSGHDHIYNRTTMLNNQKVALGQGVTYIVGGSGSGSKFYKDQGESHRFWRDVVYDSDHPVFMTLNIDLASIDVTSYAVEDNKAIVIDQFSIIK